MKQSIRGFTIVELLIVIVVIAILAAISVTAYTGVTSRANDTQRQSDIAAIKKALAAYKIDHGHYPPTLPNPGNSTFAVSSDPGFLSSLDEYTNGKAFQDPQHPAKRYWYRAFSARSYGCPASLGAYYVIFLPNNMESQNEPRIESGPCSTQNLFTSTQLPGTWVVDKTSLVVYGFQSST